LSVQIFGSTSRAWWFPLPQMLNRSICPRYEELHTAKYILFDAVPPAIGWKVRSGEEVRPGIDVQLKPRRRPELRRSVGQRPVVTGSSTGSAASGERGAEVLVHQADVYLLIIAHLIVIPVGGEVRRQVGGICQATLARRHSGRLRVRLRSDVLPSWQLGLEPGAARQ